MTTQLTAVAPDATGEPLVVSGEGSVGRFVTR